MSAKTSGQGGGTRCGFIAVVGAPNAGKSTLVNRLVGAKVTIVSPKVQTTRSRVTAIAMRGKTQLVFVDTPGIFRSPRRRLERAMVEAAWQGVRDTDAVLLVVDAARRGMDDDTQRITSGLKEQQKRAVVALNKIDLVKKPVLLSKAKALDDSGIASRIFMISAMNGEGVDDLGNHLATLMPEGPWHFPEDQLSDMPQRMLAAEITREKLFHRMHQELPYAIAVETETWEEFKDGSVRVDQVIYVERDSQRPIVLGKGGSQIKAIGEAARHELEEALGHRVHLMLRVKTRADWSESKELYESWGLEWKS